MVNAEDLRALGFADGDVVDLVSEFSDGVERRPVYPAPPAATSALPEPRAARRAPPR